MAAPTRNPVSRSFSAFCTMARRYLTDEEVINRIFEDSDDEKNDLAELLSSESESEPDEDISQSTLDPDKGDDDEQGEDEGDVNESFVQVHRKKKRLTHKKQVNDIDSSLNPDNYDEF